MLALHHEDTHDILCWKDREIVVPKVPHAGLNVLDASVRYAFGMGLITHAEFLAMRDELHERVQVD